MNKDYSISFYLDTRREKQSGKFPVKLRVFDSNIRKQKLYPTAFDFTEKEFDSIWNTKRPRKEHKETRLRIQALENRANKIASDLNVFSFEQFEQKLIRKKGEGLKVSYHYKQTIEDLKTQNRLSTASSYDYSQKALKEFVEQKTRQSFNALTFYEIDKQWLTSFEAYMKASGRSATTVGIYLRPLKALFNKAISEKEIEGEIYPFGKRKYQIPASRKTHKALSTQQIKKLYESKPETQEQQKAKDFWFFSYNCNGMNIKDIAQLQYRNLSSEKFEFYRAKTIHTSKANLKPITVHLNTYTKDFIKKYGNDDTSPENYVFDILTKDISPVKQQAKIKNFTRFINQHLKKLCKANDLPSDISSYWARHSFATFGLRNGASLEFMQESLGHKDMSTTLNYFAGFDDDTKKEFAESLMEF